MYSLELIHPYPLSYLILSVIHFFLHHFLLDPQKGKHILDTCAAPRGKTAATVVLMKDNGEIIAADRSHNKVIILYF